MAFCRLPQVDGHFLPVRWRFALDALLGDYPLFPTYIADRNRHSTLRPGVTKQKADAGRFCRAGLPGETEITILTRLGILGDVEVPVRQGVAERRSPLWLTQSRLFYF